MHRVEGEPCPNCGCPVSATHSGKAPGIITESYQCGHCGKSWRNRKRVKQKPSTDNGAPVMYTPHPIRCKCPQCGAVNPPVITTIKKVRHHRCRCGARFKSIESPT